MSLYGSSNPPSRRNSFSSASGAPSRLPSLRGIDLSALRSGIDSNLPSIRYGVDSLMQNNHQEVMQDLNERLAGYLQRVRGLEDENRRLKGEIDEITSQKCQPVRDWDSYQDPLRKMRDQVEDLNMDNAKLLLQIDNGRLAADDFKVKLEAEQAICDGVEKDTQGLRKMIDDTNFLRMKIESEVESLNEELAHLKKNHKEDVASLQDLIGNNNVKVEVDAPKNSNLNESIAQIRSQYEQMADQNRADAENAFKKKFDSMSQEANLNTKALDEARSEVNELRRQLQALEIERQTLQKTIDSLEMALRDTENHYGSIVMDLNQQIGRLQEELAACRTDIERQVREYEALLNLKSKLENEIRDYHGLLEGFGDNTKENDESLEKKL